MSRFVILQYLEVHAWLHYSVIGTTATDTHKTSDIELWGHSNASDLGMQQRFRDILSVLPPLLSVLPLERII